MTLLEVLQKKIIWLPEYAPYQMSLIKNFGRMERLQYLKDAKNIGNEIYNEWGLHKFLEDDFFVYFTTQENIEKRKAGGLQ